jgi:hypothetical protein
MRNFMRNCAFPGMDMLSDAERRKVRSRHGIHPSDESKDNKIAVTINRGDEYSDFITATYNGQSHEFVFADVNPDDKTYHIEKLAKSHCKDVHADVRADIIARCEAGTLTRKEAEQELMHAQLQATGKVPLASTLSFPQLTTGLYSFADLKAVSDLVRPPAIVKDLIYEGDKVLIAGRPKVGKTRLVHQIVFDIQSGSDFFDLKTSPRRVLIVDLENRSWMLRDRMLRMAGKKEAPNLSVWCSDALGKGMDSTPAGIQLLRECIQTTGTQVLVIDPWRLWLIGAENTAEDVVTALRRLSELQTEFPGLTIIIIHHLRKEKFDNPRQLLTDPGMWVDNVSGHQALPSHVDSVFGLERTEDENDETIVFGGVGRFIESKKMVLDDVEGDSLRFQVRKTQEALNSVLTKRQREVWRKLSALGEFRAKDLVPGVNTSKRLCYAVIEKAIAHGRLLGVEGKGYRVIKEGSERNGGFSI